MANQISGLKKITSQEIAAWTIMAVFLPLVLWLKLLPALIAGLLVYELVFIIAPYIEKRLPGYKAKAMAVGFLVIVIVSLLTLAGAGVMAFLRSDQGSLTALLSQMAMIIDDSRKLLPPWMMEHLPADAIAFKVMVSDWLREHSTMLQVFGKEAVRASVHVLIGMIIGGIIALHDAVEDDDFQPFAKALVKRTALLADSFRRIVFAQVRIAGLNAIFTGIYLGVVLPLMGIHLPLVKTLIVITFLLGLIPVAGNLVSNTIIVIVSLSQSVAVAISSLAYLVIIHKLEYFLNARIVGDQIRAHAWELLIAMLLMEAAFGVAGVIAAPIFYAYIKSELRAREQV